MDKLNMQTSNKANENFKKLAELFPNAVTEALDENGEVVRAIDKDILMQEISCKVVDGREERYQFTWPDKKKAILAANAPISKTLRPCREESVNFDSTENLYIEGDNLEVLKLLQETYLGQVKMIYIDPPYNTGNDFVYNDDFAEDTDEYLDRSGQYDEDGNRLVQNTESNGRFHTDWLNMIYPRLKLARDLLSDDGVIFISIDDNEQENLKKVCDNIFGEDNFICNFIWLSKLGKVGTTETISTVHEYVLCYTKHIDNVKFNKIEHQNDGRIENLRQWGIADRREDRPSMYYPITIDGIEVYPIKEDGTEGRWRVGKEVALQLLEKGELTLKNVNGIHNIYRSFQPGVTYIPYDTLFLADDVGRTSAGAKYLKSIGLAKMFDFSKPMDLIRHLMIMCCGIDSIILDFFSGSSTTAHAVMQLNAEDGGNRKFIMVQIPEETDEKSEAYKAGYQNICEIGKERIRRAAKKIAEDNPDAKFDGGFRVLKCDTTNMKDVYYTPAETLQMSLDGLVDNIKDDRTPEDLLFQVMLDLGILLSSKIEETDIAGKKVFIVNTDELIACFDADVTDEVITQIAKRKPYYFVMRDSSLASDSTAANFEQIFAAYSPETVRRVL